MANCLSFSAINVNSFNMSTAHCSNAKCFLKVEGITSKHHDVIFVSDCRLGCQGKKLSELFSVCKNGAYKLYTNSTKENRGVAIAIRSAVNHEIIAEYRDVVNENYLIMHVKIRGEEYGIGVVYGPNHNDREFYREIREICERLSTNNVKIILGGDFNTVLDGDLTQNNEDMVGRVQ